MKYINYFLLAVALLLISQAPSQAQPQLGLYTVSVSTTTPQLGEQLSLFTKLKNWSLTDTFSGIIDYKLACKDSIITSALVVGKPANAGFSIILAPQTEISALFTVQILGTHFKVGPDIIIVWPVASQAQIVDSARAAINIKWALGLAPNWATDFKVWVDNNQFVLSTNDQKNRLQHVRIFDLTGVLINTLEIEKDAKQVPLPPLPLGIYIAEFVTVNGETYRLKFVR